VRTRVLLWLHNPLDQSTRRFHSRKAKIAVQYAGNSLMLCWNWKPELLQEEQITREPLRNHWSYTIRYLLPKSDHQSNSFASSELLMGSNYTTLHLICYQSSRWWSVVKYRLIFCRCDGWLEYFIIFKYSIHV
jgi:hypothetical protein